MAQILKHVMAKHLGLETQIQFEATFKKVAQAFSNEYLVWPVPGLGEARGFAFHLVQSDEPFTVKTFVHLDSDSPQEAAVEWLIDAKDLAVAESVFRHLGLPRQAILWTKS